MSGRARDEGTTGYGCVVARKAGSYQARPLKTSPVDCDCELAGAVLQPFPFLVRRIAAPAPIIMMQAAIAGGFYDFTLVCVFACRSTWARYGLSR